MIQFYLDITPEAQVKGEALFLKGLKQQKPGRYRVDLYHLNKRSNLQNAYEHVVFTLAVKGLRDLGYEEIRTMEDAKKFYKDLFLTIEKPNVQTGEMYKVHRSTAELSKDETSNFIEQIREHQLEWAGVLIPTPEQYKEEMQKYHLVSLVK